MKKRRETLQNYVAPEETQSSEDWKVKVKNLMSMINNTGMMIQDPSRNANIIPVSFDDTKPEKNRGGKPFPYHLGNMHKAHASAKMPTESYRFDIMHIGNEEKCERRQFPGDRSRDHGTDKSS
jgi:hypothetical protein